jgi:hypothetical protein
MAHNLNGITLNLSWQGTTTDELQETVNLADPSSWQPFTGNLTVSNGVFNAQALITPGTGQKYYRVQQGGGK